MSQLALQILQSQCKTSKVQIEEASRMTCMHGSCSLPSTADTLAPVQSSCQVVRNSGQLMEALTGVAALLAAATDNLCRALL